MSGNEKMSPTGLDFPHPVTGQRLEIQAPLDAGFSRIMAEFDWNMGSLGQ